MTQQKQHQMKNYLLYQSRWSHTLDKAVASATFVEATEKMYAAKHPEHRNYFYYYSTTIFHLFIFDLVLKRFRNENEMHNAVPVSLEE